jgi:hypothetical protein
VPGNIMLPVIRMGGEMIAGEAYNRDLEVLEIGEVEKVIGAIGGTGDFRVLCVPNPFAGETEVRFDLPGDAFVKIAVMELQSGRIVAGSEGGFPAGSHEWVWDGRNKHGQFVAAGMYLVTMEADGRKQTVRLVYLTQ